MTKRFPAGSEWRKWDLHVHVPGTQLSDGYEKKDGKPDWDRFADAIEASDVAVFGITDYFSATRTLEFIDHFHNKYPNSEKLLLVNVELRINESLNKDGHMVDFHVIFSDKVPGEKIKEFLSKLQTQTTDHNDRPKSCSELAGNDYNDVTVARRDIKKAFGETFGYKAELTDYLIYAVPANNNGIRAEKGQQRKAGLADETDKLAHAIFGKSVANSRYFLRTDRYEDASQTSKPKPVFGGCDAHNFTDLSNWLGKAVDKRDSRQVVTWVKADPTFEGLRQTLVEPGDRVSLSELRPDAKDQYKVIKQVTFEGSDDFPEEIVFNPNLNAIIGSRSSGKSALLAHIAHAVDPEYTVSQQSLADPKRKKNELGPAAGKPWSSVESTVCNVEWADGSTNGGQVIYVPQNWLYQISDNPKEVTAKISPVLELQYPAFFRDYQRLLDSAKSCNTDIGKAVSGWFDIGDDLARIDADVKKIGDTKSIVKARDDISADIEALRVNNSLSSDALENYQTVVKDMDYKRKRINETDIEVERLNDFVTNSQDRTFSPIEGAVQVEITTSPSPSDLPEHLATVIGAHVSESRDALAARIGTALASYRGEIATEVGKLKEEISKLETDNKSLLQKHKANATLDELVRRRKVQQDSLDRIEKLENERLSLVRNQTEAVEQIVNQIASRTASLEALEESFCEDERFLDQLTFGISIDFDPEVLGALAAPFRKKREKAFLLKTDSGDYFVDAHSAQESVAVFLESLRSGKLALNGGNAPSDVARQVLLTMPEVRFTATLDEDKIGGFERSTMTPGKQALFALTLILGEAEERWTLLIDQPEDDLDSRSIYGEIVRYLVEQKKQRQIILVTHNANLVVGADAEEVLVANRHGDDRRNEGDRTFDYLTGSLEHSARNESASYDLSRMGVREHAVEILDGGEEAFQKRRDKYKI
ncbi:TrlF family AAA-like ATPase [Corynebacterium flavescens]|uniref:TrlF family AAA-like ATPase n=1 Tax=Corynebacterium flavescens TaxID=28028 RepID=UPI003FD432AE